MKNEENLNVDGCVNIDVYDSKSFCKKEVNWVLKKISNLVFIASMVFGVNACSINKSSVNNNVVVRFNLTKSSVENKNSFRINSLVLELSNIDFKKLAKKNEKLRKSVDGKSYREQRVAFNEISSSIIFKKILNLKGLLSSYNELDLDIVDDAVVILQKFNKNVMPSYNKFLLFLMLHDNFYNEFIDFSFIYKKNLVEKNDNFEVEKDMKKIYDLFESFTVDRLNTVTQTVVLMYKNSLQLNNKELFSSQSKIISFIDKTNFISDFSVLIKLVKKYEKYLNSEFLDSYYSKLKFAKQGVFSIYSGLVD